MRQRNGLSSFDRSFSHTVTRETDFGFLGIWSAVSAANIFFEDPLNLEAFLLITAVTGIRDEWKFSKFGDD
jgi:hypothetical protein